MPQIIIDADEARSFASKLAARAAAIQEKKRVMSASFSALNAVWRDEKYHQFGRVFEQASRLLDEFANRADAYSSYLRKKAQIIDDYAGRRY